MLTGWNLVKILLDEFSWKPEDSRNVADYSENANKHLQEKIEFAKIYSENYSPDQDPLQ